MIASNSPPAALAGQRLEIDAAIRRVLDSGSYILGNEVAAFEEELTQFLKVSECVGVASGTDALELALRSLGIGAGDAVLTVAHTAVATVSAIERAGAQPVFCEIDERTFTLAPDSFERTLKHYPQLRLRAVIPVHLYGHPAAMDQIVAVARQHDCLVIEDAAQAHGSSWQGRRCGTWGDAAAFSFYPTKNLGALGDGGAVVTSDSELAKKIRLLRQYGWQQRQISELPGINSRLDEIQAAILRVKLPQLETANARRQEIAARYTHALAPWLTPPYVQPEAMPVYHQYVVRCQRRGDLQKHLEREGISAPALYPLPIHLQPAYAGRYPTDPAGLSVTERVVHEMLCLPIGPTLTDASVDRVIEAVRGFYTGG